MTETTEKQATGFEMTSRIYQVDPKDSIWSVDVLQEGRRVFFADGCESRQHAEQIARDICVRYGLTKRPTI